MQEMNWSAERHALLLALLVRAAKQHFGEEADALCQSFVRQYGRERGGRMAQMAQEDGFPLTLEVYGAYREYEVKWGDFLSEKETAPDGSFFDHPYRCPWATLWEKEGLSRLGAVYCREIDGALGRGFGGELEIRTEGTMPEGQPHCDIRFTRSAAADPRVTEKLAQELPEIRKRALRPWVYHAAQLYAAAERELLGRDGEKAQAALRQVREEVAAKCGSRAVELLLKWTNLDFDTPLTAAELDEKMEWIV